MSYRFEQNTAWGEQLAQIAREQLQRAIAETSGTTEVGERIHAIRTCLKKSRSLLRFIKPSVPATFYKSQAAQLRNAARKLAALRDADVLLAAYEELKIPPKNLAGQRIHALLKRSREEALRQSATVLDATKPALVQAITSAKHWPIADFDLDAVHSGFRAVYRTARKAYSKACRKSDPETLHSWRGKTKTYWHILRLLEGVRSKPLKRQSNCAQKLGDLLGEYHDLTVLKQTLADAQCNVKGRGRVRKLLSKRCARLKSRAFTLGAKTFQDKPTALSKHLKRGLNKFLHA